MATCSAEQFEEINSLQYSDSNLYRQFIKKKQILGDSLDGTVLYLFLQLRGTFSLCSSVKNHYHVVVIKGSFSDSVYVWYALSVKIFCFIL